MTEEAPIDILTKEKMDNCIECSELEWLVDGWCERCRESLDPNFQPFGPHSIKQLYMFGDQSVEYIE